MKSNSARLEALEKQITLKADAPNVDITIHVKGNDQVDFYANGQQVTEAQYNQIIAGLPKGMEEEILVNIVGLDPENPLWSSRGNQSNQVEAPVKLAIVSRVDNGPELIMHVTPAGEYNRYYADGVEITEAEYAHLVTGRPKGELVDISANIKELQNDANE